VLAARGARVTGAIEQPRLSAWSTLLTVPTDTGAVWFRENCPGQSFEARLLALLGEAVPDAVVAPLAVEPGRGWFLTADHGATLADRVDDVDVWGHVVAQRADVQRRLVPTSTGSSQPA
jgi:hypothetical protein